jgi:hypothetical protein
MSKFVGKVTPKPTVLSLDFSTERPEKRRANDVQPVGDHIPLRGTVVKDAEVKPVGIKYNAEAVQKEIKKDKRIGGKEAKAIHALLKGRTGDADDLTAQYDKLGKRRANLLSKIMRSPSMGQGSNVEPEIEKAVKEADNLLAQMNTIAKQLPASVRRKMGVRDVAPVGDDEDDVWKRDTDKGAAELIRKDGKTMSSAEIARKYGFDLRFVKEVLGGDNQRVSDEEHYNAKAAATAQAHKDHVWCGNTACHTCKDRGLFRTPKKAKDIKPLGDAVRSLVASKRAFDVEPVPVGDAAMIDVSYKLNGPTVFQVDNSQFVEWARKNKKDIGGFASRLKALQEFTGDPRIKDWESN